MVKVKPFKGLRPPKEIVAKVAARPYEVLSSAAARVEAEGNEQSLYHITRPEIEFPAGTDEHDVQVYRRAVENFHKFQEKGWLVQDGKECYYLYAQTMGDHKQYGLVVASNVSDYLEGRIKKHELTRHDKEEDRMKHIRNTRANIEPVFFAFHDNEELQAVIDEVSAGEAEYDFTSGDGIRHQLWVVDADATIGRITRAFESLPALYIADGHHRTAAAALVGAEMAGNNPNHRGNEEYNYFLAVCFPESHLKIIDYNRLVKDLNGHSEEEFLTLLGRHFDVELRGKEIYHPSGLHNFALYMSGNWYSLTAHADTYDDNDPIRCLDVTISSKYILDEILGITDLRRDKRIDFVGGIRGLGELQARVDSGEMALALALYPVTMHQLLAIADSGNIMPPKTTWFEPKLRSGLVIHKLE